MDLQKIVVILFTIFLFFPGLAHAQKAEPDPTGTSMLGDDIRLALVEGHDLEDIEYVGANNTYNYVQMQTSEYTGTSRDPYLLINYTIPYTSMGGLRVDEWYCVSTTTANGVEETCQAPIIVWAIIAFFAVSVATMCVLFFRRPYA